MHWQTIDTPIVGFTKYLKNWFNESKDSSQAFDVIIFNVRTEQWGEKLHKLQRIAFCLQSKIYECIAWPEISEHFHQI